MYDVPGTPKKLKVPAWNASYHENDIRRLLPGRKLDTKGQPTIELSEFPSLSKLENGKVELLLEKMRGFVDEAFPSH